MPTIKQFNITLGDINFLLDQLRHTILVVGYNARGEAIYGYRDPASATGFHELGLFGSFDPLAVNGPDGLPIYAGARDAAGFRILDGFFNNLTGTQGSPGAWMWGSADEPFPRLTPAQYNSYVHQSLDNAALTNKAFQAYMDSHPALPDAQADSTALYADPGKSVVDYTPRMISQTISSSYMDHGAGVADSAMARVGAPTDTFHETITYADGHKEQVTETVIRNENTLPGDPSTSGIFTLFGQFFDHGLDFLDKGGQGSKIVIALEPSDPLYRAPGTNGANDPGNLTITISRATPDGYIVNSTSDTVNETLAGSSGLDTVLAGVNYTLTTNVENLTLTGKNINGTGNTLANLIIGSDGANVLDGGSAGADTLMGGLGDDTYIVSHAGVTVTEALNAGTDTVSTVLTSYTLEANVENLTYTGSSAFTGNGNGLDNFITGGSGADTLYGNDGNDTLNGGSAGADILNGGLGNDTYVISHAGITVSEAALAGTDTVSTTLSAYTLGLNLENLIYTGANAFTGTGNTQDNVITGGGGNDVLNGGGGNDTLIGGAGRDNLTGGAGLDTFVFRSAAEAGNGTGNNGNNADLITDFLVGTDKIDLSRIDANTQVGLDQAFIWDNTLETGNTRPAAGHLGYHYEGSGANAVTVIDGNINTSRFGNDTTVDFQIKLAGTLVLHASDFIL